MVSSGDVSGTGVPVGAKAPAVRSSLEVAIWIQDRADSANKTLDATTLQQLLYLAQTEYAKDNDGRKLMPATFLATATGPLEPTVYHIFERGRPDVRVTALSYEVSDFLMAIWDRFATLPPDALTRLVHDDLHYRHAFAQGRNHEISVTALRVVAPEPAEEEAPAPEDTKLEETSTPEEAPEFDLRGGKLVGITASGKLATRWTPGQPDDGGSGAR